MTRDAKTSCTRSWEVEASRDGRLSPDAHASMERHLTTCAACRDERRQLAELGAALGDAPPKLDDVALRKLKQSVLERADAIHSGRVAAPRPSTRWGVVLALPLVATVAAAYVIHVRSPPPLPVERALVIASPIGAAQWQRTETPSAERISLTDGSLALDVHRKRGQKPLTVAVPDGEIEDVGTVFRVSVVAGRTAEIVVTEGEVVFHRNEGGDVRVGGGMTWTAPGRPVVVVDPATLPKAAATAPATATAPRHAVFVERSVPTATPFATAPQASSVATDVPDAQDEDAAYLHIVALAREGRHAEARLAAKGYLQRFPNGFRRVEAEALAR